MDQDGVGNDALDDRNWVDGVHHRRGHDGLVDDRGVVHDWGVVHNRGRDVGLVDDRGVDNWNGLDDRGVVDGNDWGVVGNDGVLDDRGVVHNVAGRNGKRTVTREGSSRHFRRGYLRRRVADGYRSVVDDWGVDGMDNRGGNHDSWSWGSDGGGDQARENEL